MKKQEVVRLYNFADATLVTTGLEKIAYMRRDQAQFASYGINTDAMDGLEAKINAFAQRLTDVESLGNQTQATENKNAKADELRVAIRDIMARVALRHRVDSPSYQKFGTYALSQISDPELLLVAKRVFRVGNEFLADLTDQGVTTPMLSNIDNMANDFSDLIVELKIEIGNRDIEQEDRVEAANIIYDTLVKYTNTGQIIWETSDVAKFNDYVLYNTISGEPEAEAS